MFRLRLLAIAGFLVAAALVLGGCTTRAIPPAATTGYYAASVSRGDVTEIVALHLTQTAGNLIHGSLTIIRTNPAGANPVVARLVGHGAISSSFWSSPYAIKMDFKAQMALRAHPASHYDEPHSFAVKFVMMGNPSDPKNSLLISIDDLGSREWSFGTRLNKHVVYLNRTSKAEYQAQVRNLLQLQVSEHRAAADALARIAGKSESHRGKPGA